MNDETEIRQRVLGIRYLIVLSVFAAVTYLILCVFLNPPFFVTGKLNHAETDTRLTDVVTLLLMFWFFAGGLCLRFFKSKKLIMPVVSSLMLGFPIGVLVLAGIFFFKAHNAIGDVTKHFWLGQAIGTLGFGWFIVVGQLWIKWKRPHSSSSGDGKPVPER